VPADLPPPFVPEAALTTAETELEATGRMEPVESAEEPELDPRQLKALSRQERKEAKAALRREQQEARNAARQAKAMAKAAAKAERAAAAEVEPVLPPEESSESVSDEENLGDEATPDVVEPIEADALPAEGDNEPETPEPAQTPEPVATDPRARAAQRVQRRLGKDAEKLTAAEARARAREEARRRRAQAKEERSGVVAEEAVRPPEGPTEGNLAEDVSVVEMAGQAVEAEPVIDEPLIDEPIIDEVVDEPVPDEELDTPELNAPEPATPEPAVEDVVIDEEVLEEPEPDLPEPVAEQRIDELAPVDVDDEPEFQDDSIAEIAETQEISKIEPELLPMDSDEEPKTRRSMAPVAGVVGLVALGISVLLAVGALLVALGFDSGGLYEVLRTVANFLVGPLEGAFDFSGANAERKEHFLAWGAGSILYLLISFVGQAVQRANDDE
jgi:hypothetical protein